MNKAENNNIWDSFTDKLNQEKYIYEGVAFLERWYEKDKYRIRHHIKNTDDDDTVIPLPLVAKGISAYLSYLPYSDDKSLRLLLSENNTINTDAIFTRYFDNCYRFLDYTNRKIALPRKRKSKSELILEHLKIEEQYLIESEPLFIECKSWEKDTIAEIKEVALFYPEWVKNTHLKDEVQNTVIEPSKQPEQTSKAEKSKLTSDEVKSELDKIKSSENLFWKGLPMDTVISHFMVMTTTKNKNGDFFLTIEQLISFLRKGFMKDTTLPKQKINCTNGEKGFVIKRFYELFDISVSQYGHIQKKKNFINLFKEFQNQLSLR